MVALQEGEMYATCKTIFHNSVDRPRKFIVSADAVGLEKKICGTCINILVDSGGLIHSQSRGVLVADPAMLEHAGVEWRGYLSATPQEMKQAANHDETKVAKFPGGQVIEVDPTKFYILELDSEKIQPFEVEAIQQELVNAGVQLGVIIGSRGGNSIAVRPAVE